MASQRCCQPPAQHWRRTVAVMRTHMRKTTRFTLALALTGALSLGAGSVALAGPDAPDARASCAGLASANHARFDRWGGDHRADVAAFLKEVGGEIGAAPGELWSGLAQAH